MKVDKNKLVQLQYLLHRVEPDGTETEVERTADGAPLIFIHGAGMMLPDFERNLLGLSAGDPFDFTLTPEQAYGPYTDEAIIELPKEIFHVEGAFDDELVVPGAELPMLDSEGNQLTGKVLEVLGNTVRMDFNHMLAGATLHFTGHVESVSDPTPEDMAELFPSSCGSGACGCCSGCS